MHTGAYRTTPLQTRSALDDLDVNAHPGRKIQVRQGFDDLLARVQDVNEPFMNPHVELLSRIFVNEGGAIDRVRLLLSW